MVSTVPTDGLPYVGWWNPTDSSPAFGGDELLRTYTAIRQTQHIVFHPGQNALGVALAGRVLAQETGDSNAYKLLATLPPLYPEWLGDRSFQQVHGCRFPYIVGEMARGIATPAMVIAAGKAGLLGFYGSAGLEPERVDKGLQEISSALTANGHTLPWGANLIHSPNEPELEQAITMLFLERKVHRVSASAYMSLTPSIVRYACSGLQQRPDGGIERKNHVFAKVSRIEVAELFMSPPPPSVLQSLVERGELTRAEAELARHIPLAEDITVEADSGGHTDNRPLTAVFPAIQRLRERLVVEHGYTRRIRLGAAGGLGCPNGVAAAFALGAAYVLTGSINQAASESGLSVIGRQMLKDADMTDVTMAPAADMFELGVKVQVLKRGTMFAQRATKLYQIYQGYDSIDTIPQSEREALERDLFRAPLEQIWDSTRRYFEQRRPQEAERAERDPKHRLALICRWYLGNSSQWAIGGDASRRLDFQAWCGPAMGAFNRWVAGSMLESLDNRSVVQIGRNLLEGAAVITRAHQLRTYGVPLPPAAFDFRPRLLG